MSVDGKAYYGYLFEANKQPTKVLDALLRGIANHISENVGRKDEKCLVPEKLATFYKAVGGNYDSLFVEVPHPSISWIYASIGCQHTLQPTTNDFEPPSIPALTTSGFVRWQSIEILLGPEEHVPFIQNAVKNFGIKNPDNGEAFPADLPTDAFPLVPDEDIEKWHSQCAEKLRKKATPTEEEPRPNLPPRPKVQPGYAHVRPSRVRQNTVSDDPRLGRDSPYFEPQAPPTPRPVYQHVASRPVRPVMSSSPSHRARQFLAPEDPSSPRMARSRRRSYPENISSPHESPIAVQPPEVQRPVDGDHVRRHSHPRHARRGSMSSDASSSSDGESPTHVTSKTRRRSRGNTHSSNPAIEKDGPIPNGIPSGVRYAVPTADARARTREREREEDAKRRAFAVPVDMNGKLSAPFLMGGKRDRERVHRSNSRNGQNNLRWKDLDGATAEEVWRRGSTEEDEKPRAALKREKSLRDGDRERPDSERDAGYRRRERERDRDMRPKVVSSHSSHGGERDRERERERIYNNGDRERSYRERDRDRDRERDRRGQSPVRGVDGRRYPAH